MTTPPGEPPDSRALVSLTELGRTAVDQPTPTDLDRGLDTLLARIAAGKAHRRGLVHWSLVGVTAALAILAGLHFAYRSMWRLPAAEPPALAYQIEGGSVLESGYLRESGHGGIKLLFNEGSKFALTPGTRGWVRAIDKDGPRVAIERGTASCRVTPSRERRWLVEVGPFLVTVKGTVFTVSWDPLSEQFELRLKRGRVVVSGPVSGGDIALLAGQRLHVSLSKAETVITDENVANVENVENVENVDGVAGDTSGALAPPPQDSPAAQPSVEREPVERERPAGRSRSTVLAPSTTTKADVRDWSEALAGGHWDRILEDVKRAGLQATLDTASSEDLFVLATAARYRRRTEWARAALLAERRRFPDSPRALEALFLLGRVEESRERGASRAIAWYDEYLTHAPTGTFAAEALGRKLTLTSELEGPAQARTIAEDYLRRFPNGSYAGSARALRRVP